MGEAVDGEQSVRLAEERRPDLFLMDIRMPGLDGLAATRIIQDRWPEIRMVVRAMYTDYTANDALEAGADAFQFKGRPTEELLDAILART